MTESTPTIRQHDMRTGETIALKFLAYGGMIIISRTNDPGAEAVIQPTAEQLRSISEWAAAAADSMEGGA